MIKFNDGVNIDTSGPLRMLQLIDGLYIVGQGMCIPVSDEEEALALIKQFTRLQEKPKEAEDGSR